MKLWASHSPYSAKFFCKSVWRKKAFIQDKNLIKNRIIMPTTTTRIPASYLRVFLATTKNLGHKVNPDWFPPQLTRLINTNIESANTDSSSVELCDLSSIIGTIVQKTRDARLTFEFGSRLTLHRHGFLGYAAGSAKTLREMILLEARYFDTQVPTIRVRLEEFETFFNTIIHIDAERSHVALYMEILLASSQKILIDLGIPRKLMRFSYANLSYPKPEHGNFYDEYFAFSLRFDQPHNGFTSNVALLNLINSYHDPALNEITLERLNHISRREKSLLIEVTRYISKNIAGNPRYLALAQILFRNVRGACSENIKLRGSQNLFEDLL